MLPLSLFLLVIPTVFASHEIEYSTPFDCPSHDSGYSCIFRTKRKNIFSARGTTIDENSVVSVEDLNRSHYVLFKEGLSRVGGSTDCLGYRFGDGVKWLSYDRVHREILDVGRGLSTVNGGISDHIFDDEEKNDGYFKLIGLYSLNKYQWTVSDIAASAFGYTSVAIHATLSFTSVETVLSKTKLGVLMTERQRLPNLQKIYANLPQLKTIIIFDYDAMNSEEEEICAEIQKGSNIKIFSYDYIVEAGREQSENANKDNVTTNHADDDDGEYDLQQHDDDYDFDSEEDFWNKSRFHAYKHHVTISKKVAKDDNDATKEEIPDEKGISKKENFDNKKEYATKARLLISALKRKRKLHKYNGMPLKQNDANFICTIVVTSGTTSAEKGVMLTNRNIFTTVTSIVLAEGFTGISAGPSDVHASYLPASHILERITQAYVLSRGGKIAFYSGVRENIGSDFVAMKPTFVVVVPRVVSIILKKLEEALSQKKLLRRIINRMVARKIKKNSINAVFYDKILKISKKIRKKLFGHTNIRYMVSGGAKLSADNQLRIRSLLGIPVIQGYGLTETVGASVSQHLQDMSSGIIGGPMPGVDIRFKSWEDFDATANEPEGEILIRSETLFVGYFREKEATQEYFDDMGFYHTGDIGHMNPNGSIEIIDRKKSLLKLASGEYLACRKVENVYMKSPFLDNAFVFGHDDESFPIAIVSVDSNYINNTYCPSISTPQQKRLGCPVEYIDDEELEQQQKFKIDRINEYRIDVTSQVKRLSKNEKLRSLIFEDLQRLGIEHNLLGFEKVKGIIVSDFQWTPKSGFVTPTDKLKSNVIRTFFSEEIRDLYAKINAKK